MSDLSKRFSYIQKVRTPQSHLCMLSSVLVMQCLKKLCHDFRHEISFHLIYVNSIFYHNFLLLDLQIS